MHEPLRRYDAFGDFVAFAPVINDVEFAALKRCTRQHGEPLAGRTRRHAEYAHTARGFAELKPFVFEQFSNAAG